MPFGQLRQFPRLKSLFLSFSKTRHFMLVWHRCFFTVYFCYMKMNKFKLFLTFLTNCANWRFFDLCLLLCFLSKLVFTRNHLTHSQKWLLQELWSFRKLKKEDISVDNFYILMIILIDIDGNDNSQFRAACCIDIHTKNWTAK